MTHEEPTSVRAAFAAGALDGSPRTSYTEAEALAALAAIAPTREELRAGAAYNGLLAALAGAISQATGGGDHWRIIELLRNRRADFGRLERLYDEAFARIAKPLASPEAGALDNLAARVRAGFDDEAAKRWGDQ